MHIRELFRGQYLIYGLSIVVARGAELAVMFFAAHYLAKAVYGELEYYKKVLELGGAFLSFGFPALILTYTRSRSSKWYLLIFSLLFILGLSLISIPVLWVIRQTYFWGGFVFYAIFFTGGVVPVYFLVRKGSVAASIYKAVVALLFYGLVLASILFSKYPQFGFIKAAYFMLVAGTFLLIYEGRKEKIYWPKLKRYIYHFKKLIFSSFTLLVANFSNMMFLYTDIFVIKILSAKSGIDIANYVFPLNVANILMLIPFSLIQVDIERYKKDLSYYRILHGKINILIILLGIVLGVTYWILITTYFDKFSGTFSLFLIILLAKIFQAKGSLFGTGLLIQKKYIINLYTNLAMIVVNIILSSLLFISYGLVGVAIASLAGLFIRYLIMHRFFLLYLEQK